MHKFANHINYMIEIYTRLLATLQYGIWDIYSTFLSKYEHYATHNLKWITKILSVTP
jgi:hypothetical protein